MYSCEFITQHPVLTVSEAWDIINEHEGKPQLAHVDDIFNIKSDHCCLSRAGYANKVSTKRLFEWLDY